MYSWWEYIEDSQGLLISMVASLLGLYIYTKILQLSPSMLKPKTFLKGLNTKVKGTIIDRQQITHDTLIFKVSLDHKDQKLGLPICQHVRI